MPDLDERQVTAQMDARQPRLAIHVSAGFGASRVPIPSMLSSQSWNEIGRAIEWDVHSVCAKRLGAARCVGHVWDRFRL